MQKEAQLRGRESKPAKSAPATAVTVAVMWPSFGPYHVARLRTAAELLACRGARLVAIETARAEATYAWHRIGDASEFQRHTLFPHSDYGDLRPKSLREAVRATLATIEPDVVAVCGIAVPESRAAISWCRRRSRVVVLMSASSFHDKRRRWYKEAIKRRLVRACDAALVAGSRQTDYMKLLGMGPARIFVGYDCVDNAHFQRAATELREGQKMRPPQCRASDRPCFLSVARFVWQKNLLAAIDAYARYRSIVGSGAWDWMLCGGGPLGARISEKRKALGLREHILLPGFIQYEELPKYYAAARALWLPSISETWGLVVNEAMACGLPVLVSSRAGCALDLVDEGGNGWTFDPKSTDDMAKALARMHRISGSERAEMGERSGEIVANWGTERFAEGLWRATVAGTEFAKRRNSALGLVDRSILRACDLFT